MNDELENLIPLCNSCHRKVHDRQPDNDVLRRLIRVLDENDESGVVEVSPDGYDDVPQKATIVAKETYPGKKYYYWQWRDGDTIRSVYIGRPDQKVVKDDGQRELVEFC